AGAYYTTAVEWAAANNIVKGYGDGRFGPDDNITREQLAAIIMRYAGYANKQFPVTRQFVTFADDAQIADYAKNAVQALYNGGIISGKPNLSPEGGNLFDPRGEATRAEVAAMLHRFILASGG
ncbi:MAG: S-layer homology domain-containing protein, partial [Syntrophomonadaceae bacterium]|nr:S-layer homology domain-containing protein [Syntrophomonadaceae bacterium]